MSKKTKTVYNLEDDTILIKIDAKPKECLCKQEEKQELLKNKNKQQVYQQYTPKQAFKLPFHQENQQLYPVSVTVEKVGKPRRSSGSSRSDSYKTATKPTVLLQEDQEDEYSVSNEFDQNSSRNSSIGSKSTKSSSLNDRERISVISEENRSFYDGEENIIATPLKGSSRTEVDLSVSNIEIAHYPFKYSDRSPSLVPSPATPRNSKDSDELPFSTNSRPVTMMASITDEDAISASISESTISVLDINDAPFRIQPRDHGQHCAIEVSVLEKHKDGCTNKKEIVGRNMEDKVGSYDVVSRVVYRTCGPDKKVIKNHIKNSLKSYHLDNPAFFGKDLQEARSRVETIPILPNYKCVLTADFPNADKTFGEISRGKRNSIESETSHQPEDIPILRGFQPPEVLSVYIRTDKNERVPDGFQKMHYRGDSCKLHDPEERTKQILQLQKVIEETSSEAYLSKSPRRFSDQPEAIAEAQVMAATAVADHPAPIHATVIPQISPPSESEEETDDESITSLTEKIHYDRDSLDRLPPHVKGNDEMVVSTGLFNCFRRNRQKKQREASIEYVRDLSGKRVTHSNDQPKRHNEERSGSSNQRKLSNEYKR